MTEDREIAVDASEIDVGRPIEWLVDSQRSDVVLGVTYVFSRSGERRTVWYTPNKRRPKTFVVLAVPVAT